jgi:hypothetical protein
MLADCDRGMDALAECITNPSFIESYISNAAKKQGITIPPHPNIDGTDILLKLKPPHWRLKQFREYMDCLISCRPVGVKHNKEDLLLSGILYRKELFFRLDKNLNREDIEFMLRDLIQIPLIYKFPTRFTGESIVKGELSKFLVPEDLAEVMIFIDSSRNAFDAHLNLISCFLPNDCIESLLAKFHLPRDSTSMMVALHAYPQIPMAFRSPGRRANQNSHLVKEPEENLKGTIPDHSVKEEKRKNTEAKE